MLLNNRLLFKKLILKELFNDYLNKINSNSDLFNRIPMLDSLIDGNDILLVLLDDEQIIAVLAFEMAEKTLINKMLSVDSNYRRQGLGSYLLEKQFEFAQFHQLNIENSNYSNEGLLYMKEKNKEYSKNYNVKFCEHCD